jgi:hypothetical protein
MVDVRPSHLIITLGAEIQDGRDLYSEHTLTCAGCGTTNSTGATWDLPGLCQECAMRVESVTVAAPRMET